MATTQRLQKKFEAIAKEHLFVETLEVRRSDRLDFTDCSVWGIQAALEAAYRLGREDEQKASRKKH